MKRISSLAASMARIIGALFAALVAAWAHADAPPSLQVQEIRQGLYWLSDGAYNTMFLVSSAGVIAVDPLPSMGVRYLQAIRSVTTQPITHVIYSHAHLDHIGAAHLMPKEATIIAQRETAEHLRRKADPRRPLPDIVFDDHYTLTVGDQTLELAYFGANHSIGNSYIYAPAQKVLMLVDVVYPGFAPYPSLGAGVDVGGLIAAHRQALNYGFTDFIGGHVDRTGTRADVQASMAFITDLQVTTTQALQAMPFASYLQERTGSTSSTWFLHDDYENEIVETCTRQMTRRWVTQLTGLPRSLRSHCRSMLVALEVDGSPTFPSESNAGGSH